MSNEALAIQSLFYILNKDRDKVQFAPNDAQLMFENVDNPQGRARVIIAKCRQKGFTSWVSAKFSIRCLGKDGTAAVVISHEGSATQRILDKVSYYFKHMNGPQPQFGFNSRKEMTFPRRDSTYYIGTAGSRAFGRGDTISDLHCSEYAWWENPEKHTTGLFQAVPYNGRIYIESTGNGRNNDFYYIWSHAEEMGYTRLFYPWYYDNEYTLPTDTWVPDLTQHIPYMREIQGKFDISPSKMSWYESKLKELREDLSMMQQEYPTTPDECFQATGGTVFPNIEIAYSPYWIQKTYEGYYVHLLEGHPIPGYHYVMGCDPSGGTGGDNSAITIFCIETGEQVFEFFYNTVNPISFGELSVVLGFAYNEAFIVCESNNHGAAVIPYLRDNYRRGKIYARKYATASTPAMYGWLNTDVNKHALIGVMLETIDQITIYGKQTHKEISEFEEVDGKLAGVKDDLVIATGLAMLGLKKFEHLKREFEMPQKIRAMEKRSYMTYTLDEVLDNISQRRKGLGFDKDQSDYGFPYH